MSRTAVLSSLAHTFGPGCYPSLHARPDARLLASSAQSTVAESVGSLCSIIAIDPADPFHPEVETDCGVVCRFGFILSDPFPANITIFEHLSRSILCRCKPRS